MTGGPDQPTRPVDDEVATVLRRLDGVEERLRIAYDVLQDGDAPVRVRAVVQAARDDVRRARAALVPAYDA